MDAQAQFKSVADEYRHQLYTFSHYYLGRGEDAEDVTQEVLVRLWKNWGKFDPEKLQAWLFRVARNACMDCLRKRKRYRAMVAEGDYDAFVSAAPDEQPDPGLASEQNDTQQYIVATIQNISEPYRSIVLLREVHEMPYGEISETLGIPLNTVKSHLHRGRRMLRELFREKVAHGEL